MPKIRSQPYVEWDLTDEEMIVATVFTELQTAYIETELSRVAIEKANLSFIPGSADSEKSFIYQSEYLRGRLEAFQELLNTSDDTKLKLQRLHAFQAARQAADSDGIAHTAFPMG